MYVKAYLDLSLKSLVCFGCCFRPVHLEAWPGVPGCRGGLRPFVVLLFLFGS